MSAQQIAGKRAMSSGKYNKPQVSGAPGWIEGLEHAFGCCWSLTKTAEDRQGHPFEGTCGKVFPDAEKLFLHLMDAHYRSALEIGGAPDGKKHVRLCGWGGCSKTLENLKRHLESHAGFRRFPCTSRGCGREFLTAHHLSTHTQTHKGVRLQCDNCGSKFATKHGLQAHQRAVHGPEGRRRKQCPVEGCQYADHDSSNMSKHRKVHDETAPVCRWTDCQYRDKQFASMTRDGRPKGMWNHMLAVHGVVEDMRAQYMQDHVDQVNGEVSPAGSAALNAVVPHAAASLHPAAFHEMEPSLANSLVPSPRTTSDLTSGWAASCSGSSGSPSFSSAASSEPHQPAALSQQNGTGSSADPIMGSWDGDGDWKAILRQIHMGIDENYMFL